MVAKIQADEISSIIKERIDNFELSVDINETGKIVSYADGVAWNPTTNALCGGPGNPPCPGGPVVLPRSLA